MLVWRNIAGVLAAYFAYGHADTIPGTKYNPPCITRYDY